MKKSYAVLLASHGHKDVDVHETSQIAELKIAADAFKVCEQSWYSVC
jgi:hypothetical protein